MLLDTFGRTHDYLRISLTDVCNFRCDYCMPEENIRFMPAAHLMQLAEIEAIAKEFVQLGVKKIRLTGGEPLARKDAKDIILALSQNLVELTLTTNGSQVHDFISTFQQAGIQSVNVSLDTLHQHKFHKITRRDLFAKVWKNIHLLLEHNFVVKVNVVLMRGVNEDEILDFIEWTKHLPLHIRFIEFMPFTGNKWDNDRVFSYQEILETVASAYDFTKIKDEANDTAKKFTLHNHLGSFAIISTMTAPFCAGCNRMRLTADGENEKLLVF